MTSDEIMAEMRESWNFIEKLLVAPLPEGEVVSAGIDALVYVPAREVQVEAKK